MITWKYDLNFGLHYDILDKKYDISEIICFFILFKDWLFNGSPNQTNFICLSTTLSLIWIQSIHILVKTFLEIGTLMNATNASLPDEIRAWWSKIEM